MPDEVDAAQPDDTPKAPVVADGGTPSYGIDAPPIVLTFFVLGIVALLIATFSAGGGSIAGAVGPLVAAVILFAGGAYAVYGSLRGKPALWEQALDGLGLEGDERALDLGCGRGLVLIGLAERLPRGAVTGIDLWRGRDQSGNRREVTEVNVAAAGVADRVEVVDGDMVELPFEDGSFDVVTAGFSIHNIPLADGRRQAVGEAARVLRTGGRMVILDVRCTGEYQQALEELEVFEVERSGRRWSTYPPSRWVTATKVGGSARSERDRRRSA